jgi:hypothetical protein
MPVALYPVGNLGSHRSKEEAGDVAKETTRKESSMSQVISFRPLNVTLGPQSRALTAYSARASIAHTDIAAGFDPRPDLDLTNRGGHTVSAMTFVNRYLGGAAAWDNGDRVAIDDALSASLSDPGLQNVMQQYFDSPISSVMQASDYVEGALAHKFFKDNAEKMVTDLYNSGVLGDADPANTILNLMLPRGVILVDGNSDGSNAEAPHAAAVLVDDDQVDSTHGLGGYHGSVHVTNTGVQQPAAGARRDVTVYYSVGVYSEGRNGIVAFDRPWKNVAATFYHEINEFRTDPDVEDVIRTGNAALLGWYSEKGGEIGDIPMTLSGGDLSLIMQEVKTADGSPAPVQFMWSNAVDGPEGPTDKPR